MGRCGFYLLLLLELLSTVNSIGFSVACGGQSQEKSPCVMLRLLSPVPYYQHFINLNARQREED